MATFLNQERTKIGTTTGTLIAFPQELEVNDPNVGNSAQLLPAGYLRCDGGIYSSAVYPALAEILGTGAACAFRQEGQTLGDTQFQVPDLRSKFIRASSASDQGVINDNTVTNASGQVVERSGVGVNVSSNVGSVATVDMVGQFRVPPRTVTLTGNVGFTRPRRPDEEIVSINGFLPHMHYTTTFRCRTIRRQGSDVFEINYYNNASTIGVENWYDATDSGDPDGRQPACKHYQQSVAWNNNSYIPSDTFASYEYYGICKGSCGGFINSCLIPTGKQMQITATPEGECWQTFSVFGIGLLRVEMTCKSSNPVMGANYVFGATGVGNDDIPTAASSPGGVVQSFELYETGVNQTTQGYSTKGLGVWAYSGYGGAANTWNNLGDFGQGEVDMIGGTGTGFRVLCRFEAWPGAGGNPTNTRYKIISFVDGGVNYTAGDVLTFPDVQGKNIGSASATGSGGISLEIATTSYGADAAAGAAYPHNTSLHNVLPVDVQVGSNINAAYPQVANVVETTEPFDYDSDPTRHTHTINYSTGLTNYKIDIPETFISTDGMNASIAIQPETDTKIDNLISPFVMVDYLIKT
jgi:hypothetical protein